MARGWSSEGQLLTLTYAGVQEPGPAGPGMSAPSARLSRIDGTPGRPNEKYRELASPEDVARTAEALRGNGMTVFVEPTPDAARERVRALVPEGAEVFTATSRTLDETAISDLLNKSGKYRSVRASQAGMDRKTQFREMVKMGAAPEWVVGSVHALTEQGQVVVASATGSQLSAYAAGAAKVVWVVGSQKIVPDLSAAIDRVRETAFPMEDERARQAYGVGSRISKLLIVQFEPTPDRVSVVLVNARLGF